MGNEAPSEGEAPLLPKRRNWEGDWPKSIKYLIWNEFCERFSYYGLKTILALYMVQHLRLGENSAAEYVHLFVVLSYIAPLFGAILSDSVLGKYRTVLYVSLLYSVGNVVLASSAVPGTDSESIRLPYLLTAVGLVLISAGTGGIKPCVSAFGGDQIEYTLPEGPVKERLKRQFFSMYYFSVNAGALISTILTPILRTNVSYAVAFGVPAVLMIIAVAIFWAGSKHYVDKAPEGNVFGQVWGVLVDAGKQKGKGTAPSSSERTPGAIEAADDDVGLLEGTDGESNQRTRKHWLDSAKNTQGSTAVEDVKALLGVLVVLLPAPLFWSLSDQQSSKWVFQGSQMDRQLPWWLGGFSIEEDQMQALNPLLVLGMIPIFDQIIYPFFANRGSALKPIPRMWIGIFLSAVAFAMSALLQLYIESNFLPGSDVLSTVSIFWQIPQYIVVTSGEILFSITGLEFAYSEAPESMKSAVQAIWLFCVAGGNIVTVIIFAVVGDSLSKANEYFFFAVLAVIAALTMIWLSLGFNYKKGSTIHNPEDTPKVAAGVMS